MASALAALLPLAISEAPKIFDLVVNLVHRFVPEAEAKFGSGTGAAKEGDVFVNVIGALQNAAKAGVIPKELPSDDVIKAVIKVVVDTLNKFNFLSPENANTLLKIVAPAAATNTPVQTQTVPIATGSCTLVFTNGALSSVK